MLFGKEFAKLATAMVDQLKIMKKCNKSEEKSLSSYHPRNYQSGVGVDTKVAVDDITHTAEGTGA